MKNLILCLLLMGFISVGHSQIVLKETKVDYSPVSMKIDPNTELLIVSLPEKYVGHFQQDPLTFIRENFDAEKLALENREYGFDSFDVEFRTTKGNVLAKYDRHGEMVSTYQQFKNVPLPDNVRLHLMQQYRNGRVVANKHIVTSKEWNIEKDFYRIKIKDGDKTRRLRVESSASGIVLVSN
ncbi:hypothetical protein ACFSTG_12730 [Salinimicrobium flavum]|uniref:Beta-lactamase-inhibitor-like, PepSY-like n=1 Tax=Salinimicrobium flavum TaxID=1737065 RepID=A0ABW5J0G7_9FLAO